MNRFSIILGNGLNLNSQARCGPIRRRLDGDVIFQATMTTIEIIGWNKHPAPVTGWAAHARSELKQRLRRGIKASPAEIRRLARQISDRQLLSIPQVFDEAVIGISQILESSGADLRVSLEHSDTAQLLKKCPDR